jgi:hypothetical protein
MEDEVKPTKRSGILDERLVLAMSMHEFEDLVEYSIRALASSTLADTLDVRSACWWLYDFQNHWDTGFTHFRVMDILLDFRFAYRFALQQHPDYEQQRDYFDALKDFTFILVKPNEPSGKGWFDPVKGWTSENPVAGYYKAPYLYCDAGSPLWERMVEIGVLTGGDSLAPDETMGISGAVLAVARAAEQQNDLRLISDWYGYLALQLASFGGDLDALATDKVLAEFVALIKRLDAGDKERSAQPLMAMQGKIVALIEDVPAYIKQIKDVRRTQSDPNA